MVRRRRALLRGTPREIVASPADVTRRVKFFGSRCCFCGGAYECIDHLWALHRAGLHTRDNLYPACRRCNGSKGDKPWYDWYVEQPFFSRQRVALIREAFVMEHPR
jgi:5-methylcytosine-specific restriction endonuclease McrA